MAALLPGRRGRRRAGAAALAGRRRRRRRARRASRLRPDRELHDLEPVRPRSRCCRDRPCRSTSTRRGRAGTARPARCRGSGPPSGSRRPSSRAPVSQSRSGVRVASSSSTCTGPAARAVEAVDHVDLLLQPGLLALEGRHLVELRLELLDVVLHLRDADLATRDLLGELACQKPIAPSDRAAARARAACSCWRMSALRRASRTGSRLISSIRNPSAAGRARRRHRAPARPRRGSSLRTSIRDHARQRIHDLDLASRCAPGRPPAARPRATPPPQSRTRSIRLSALVAEKKSSERLISPITVSVTSRIACSTSCGTTSWLSSRAGRRA